MDLKEIAQFLDDNAPAFLATLGTCGNPRVRPIQSCKGYFKKNM